MEIVKSDLSGMNLHVRGNSGREIWNTLNTDQTLPLIKFENSTINHFTGTFIQLNMFDSLMVVNTHGILLPVFTMRTSTAKIYNSIFKGVKNMVGLESPAQNLNTSVIFDVKDSCNIVIRDCVFENIQMEMGYEVSAAIYALYSQVEIQDSNFTENIARWGVIFSTASNVTVTNSVSLLNSGEHGTSINVQKYSILEVQGSKFTNNTAKVGAAIQAVYKTSVYVTNTIFTYNIADYGSGIQAASQVSILIIDSIFSHNTGYVGVAMDVGENCSLEVVNSTFTMNKADYSLPQDQLLGWHSAYLGIIQQCRV